MENMIALLKITGVVAAIFLVAVFALVAWVKCELSDDILGDDYLEDLCNEEKGVEE